jgi:hypothetical protein
MADGLDDPHAALLQTSATRRQHQVGRRSPWATFKEGLRIFHQPFALIEHVTPFLRQALRSIESTGQLAADGAGGVGIVAEVDGQENGFPERGGAVKGP